MMGERCGIRSSILLMALDIVIQIVECLYTWQVRYRNLNLECILNYSNQVYSPFEMLDYFYSKQEENGAIMRELDEFSRCGLMGIIIRLDDEVVGYAYGVCLTDDCFDILVEKGNRDILHIYRLFTCRRPANKKKI